MHRSYLAFSEGQLHTCQPTPTPHCAVPAQMHGPGGRVKKCRPGGQLDNPNESGTYDRTPCRCHGGTTSPAAAENRQSGRIGLPLQNTRFKTASDACWNQQCAERSSGLRLPDGHASDSTSSDFVVHPRSRKKPESDRVENRDLVAGPMAQSRPSRRVSPVGSAPGILYCSSETPAQRAETR